MANIVAGDLRQLSIKHEELGDLILDVKATEDISIFLGGRVSQDDDGNVTHNFKRIDVKNVKPWSMECTAADEIGVQEKLIALSESNIECTVTGIFSNGQVYAGEGTPVGDFMSNKQAGTIPFKIQGSGKFESVS